LEDCYGGDGMGWGVVIDLAGNIVSVQVIASLDDISTMHHRLFLACTRCSTIRRRCIGIYIRIERWFLLLLGAGNVSVVIE